MLSPADARRLRRETGGTATRLSAVFSALSDRSRFHMFLLLLRYRNLCVTDMARVVGVTVPAASQQLKVLEGSGLIAPERQGQKICYRVQLHNSLVRSVVRIINQ